MKTRGKKLILKDGDDVLQPLEELFYQMLYGAALTLAYDNIDRHSPPWAGKKPPPRFSAAVRLDARKTLRRAAEALAIYERDRLNQKQRGGGSAGKLNPAQKKRMREQYAARVRDGQKYGAIKHLENTFGVDRRTVHSVLNEEK